MDVSHIERDTGPPVEDFLGLAAAAPVLATELRTLVQLGLIELIDDRTGELRCAVTEFGAAIGGAPPISDNMEEKS
jgi:hypothetical protein